MDNEKNMNIDFSVVNDVKGYYAVAMTNEYRIGEWPISDRDNIDFDAISSKILELRVFNEEEEHKWFRGSIGESLVYRKLSDWEVNDCYEEPIEEYQILDIDLSRNKLNNTPGMVSTSKGGNFYLPIAKGEGIPCVRVKYYVPKYVEDVESTIHVYVNDWRLAGFLLKEREGYTNG